ncbi:MAG: ribosomal protein S18-alanine N-acetyltransferase [Halobacteriaceae archaeon]
MSHPKLSDEIEIRQATRADLLEIMEIEKNSFPQPWPYDAFARNLSNTGFFVAEYASGNNRTVVGFVVSDTIPNHGSPLGHIKDLAVDSAFREQGIGSALLERALAYLRSQDVNRVKLEVRESNEAAISLYNSFGFEYHQTIQNYYKDGENAYVLVSNLLK